MISNRWNLAVGPVLMLGGVFASITAATLLWEVQKYKSEKEPPKGSK